MCTYNTSIAKVGTNLYRIVDITWLTHRGCERLQTSHVDGASVIDEFQRLPKSHMCSEKL